MTWWHFVASSRLQIEYNSRIMALVLRSYKFDQIGSKGNVLSIQWTAEFGIVGCLMEIT